MKHFFSMKASSSCNVKKRSENQGECRNLLGNLCSRLFRPHLQLKAILRRSPENQRQLDAQMQPLIAKWQRMTKRSGSYDNVVRSCSPDGSLACTSTPTSLPPCVSVHRPPKNLEREHNAATTVKFYAVARDRDAAQPAVRCTGAGCCSSRSLSRSQPAAGLCCWVSP